MLRLRTDPQQRPQSEPVPALTAGLNSALQTGAVPAGLNLSLVTTSTSGDLSRAWITTGQLRSAARCFTCMRCCLNKRLGDYREAAQLRAPTQAGFHPHLSTMHQVLTLQYLGDRARGGLQPQALLCCFLDLKGAYDCVPCSLLWAGRVATPGRARAHAGCRAEARYANAEYAVHFCGRCGDSLLSGCGVKKGGPLGPMLFGLLGGLHTALLQRVSNAAPQVAGVGAVLDLGYADDFCLLSTRVHHAGVLAAAGHSRRCLLRPGVP